MFSSSYASKGLILVPILAIQLLIPSVSCLDMTNSYLNHKCYTSQGKYKPGSVYEKDLTSVVGSIPLSNFTIGSDMMSHGKGPNFVSAFVQCRGDSYGPKCGSCYATALSGLRKRCPRYKGGIIWYDQCLLEISGIDTLGKVDYKNSLCMSDDKKVSSDQDSFKEKWVSLLNNLTDVVSSKKNVYYGYPAMYAAGEVKLGAKKKLYAMVQCTKDIPFKNCRMCVENLAKRFKDCWYSTRGSKVLGRSCYFRFELYQFVSTNAIAK